MRWLENALQDLRFALRMAGRISCLKFVPPISQRRRASRRSWSQ